MPAVVPDSVAKALSNSDPVRSELSDAEKAAFASLDAFYGEICRAPRSWGERAYRKLLYWNEAVPA
jgi:hypothetical protein